MMIVKQSSLNRAVDMLVAEKIEDKDVLKVAQRFADWVMSKEAAPKAVVAPVKVNEPVKQVENLVATTDVSDLPF